MDSGEPARRTPEIEELSNLYVIHPIASRLTRLFAKLGVTPNAVSLTGMLFGILAGVAYYHYRTTGYAVAGFALMIAWHVMDGADGQLARLTNAQSQTGKMLDGICDYVTFIAVYSSLGAALSPTVGGGVWFLILAAGLCHAVQSAAYEVQRQEYNFWGKGQKSADPFGTSAPPAGAGVLDRLYGLYAAVQVRVAGVVLEHRRRLGQMLEQEPARAALIRRRYREVFAPSVRRWAVLSANYRTLGIFICAVLGMPLFYFVFEIVGFTMILMALISRQNALYERFFSSL